MKKFEDLTDSEKAEMIQGARIAYADTTGKADQFWADVEEARRSREAREEAHGPKIRPRNRP